ncbi:MAG: hypothetical protein ACREBG_25370, partial [Pyrinomonadaceae bacterium]
WILNSESGGATGSELNGCQIIQTMSGYKLTDSTATTTLSSSTTNPPVFSEFEFQGNKWTVSVSAPLVQGTSTSGIWNNDAKPTSPTGDENGSWTAQAGTQVPDEKAPKATSESEGEKAASADAS